MWEMGKGEAGSLARKTFLTPFFKEIDMLNPTSYGISDSVSATCENLERNLKN